MKIGLDLRMIDGGSGIARYATELSQAILTNDKKNQYVLFFYEITPAIKNTYEKFGHKMIETKIKHYSWDEQFVFPGILRREKLDLVHFPHFNAPIFYKGKFVVTIHDLTHTKFPGRKKSHFLHRVAYNAVLSSAIEKSSKIIAVSESTKKELLEHFGVMPDKIQVVYEGVNQNYKMMNKDEALAKVSNRFNLSKPYILYVGVFRRYKNLPNLAKAYEMLRNAGVDCHLVLAGEEDPFYPEIKQQILASKYAFDIKLVGRVTDEELNWLYNGSNLFVLPSLSEGFGLTVLEAASTGVPIACSDIPTLREIMGQGAEYFDPGNPENMKDVLVSILHNPTRGEELANLALRRASHFSWKQAGESTVQLYEEINA